MLNGVIVTGTNFYFEHVLVYGKEKFLKNGHKFPISHQGTKLTITGCGNEYIKFIVIPNWLSCDSAGI